MLTTILLTLILFSVVGLIAFRVAYQTNTGDWETIALLMMIYLMVGGIVPVLMLFGIAVAEWVP